MVVILQPTARTITATLHISTYSPSFIAPHDLLAQIGWPSGIDQILRGKRRLMKLHVFVDPSSFCEKLRDSKMLLQQILEGLLHLLLKDVKKNTTSDQLKWKKIMTLCHALDLNLSGISRILRLFEWEMPWFSPENCWKRQHRQHQIQETLASKEDMSLPGQL